MGDRNPLVPLPLIPHPPSPIPPMALDSPASPRPQYVPGEAPPRAVADADLVWTADEQAQVDTFRAQYPTPDGAVMKTLWLAQRKFGWLPAEVMQLVADTLGIPYAKVYGVATFYTQYFKEEKGRYVFDVCTSFSCQVTGGYDILRYLENALGIRRGQTTPDGLFTIQEAECLGACGTAPMLQVTNGEYVHNLTTAKVDVLLDALRAGRDLPFESVTLPQDQDELGGNRRTDAEAVEGSVVPPVATHLH